MSLAQVEPTPLASPPLPPFPVDALPPWGAAMVNAVAEALQVPLDLPAGCLLGALSACTAGRAEVQVRSGWREPTALYLAMVAEPGERKSPTLRVMTNPLREAERALRKDTEESRRMAALQRDQAMEAAAAARAIAVKPKSDSAALAEASAAEAVAAALAVPETPRLLAGGDSTPEAVAGLLARYGRIAIVDTEGGLFDHLSGRRSTGNPNLDVVLQAWSGDPVAIDRRGRDPEYVERPSLVVVIMVQPVTMRRVVRDVDMAGRGLIARFLPLVPDGYVGRRRTGDDVIPVDDDLMAAYGQRLQDLAVGMHGWSDPAVLRLSRDAQALLFKHEAAVEARLAPGGSLRPIAEWGAKLVGQTARLAGVLHLADLGEKRGTRTDVDVETVRGAIEIAEYAEAHATAALLDAPRSRDGDPESTALRKLVEHDLKEFRIRDLHRRLRGAEWRESSAVRDVIRALSDAGWVARVEGVPSEVYVTHPAAFPSQVGNQ